MKSIQEYVLETLRGLTTDIWKRIQAGNFEGPETAKSIIALYQTLEKAQKQAEAGLSQSEMKLNI